MSEQGQPPQTLVQAGGRVAEGIIGGFQGAPTLLLIVILQLAMMLIAGYFLIRQDEMRGRTVNELVVLIRACILETTPNVTLQGRGE